MYTHAAYNILDKNNSELMDKILILIVPIIMYITNKYQSKLNHD